MCVYINIYDVCLVLCYKLLRQYALCLAMLWYVLVSVWIHLASEKTAWIINSCSFNIPTPIEGDGGGEKTKLSNSIFLLGNPGIVIQPLKWNCKVTFLNKPWALARKYSRLAPEELSASMMTAAQFLEGCHPYICAASVWHVLNFHLLANDMEWWGILIIEKALLQKWNFKMKFQCDSPPQIQFLRG